jgi:hypothetical protein
MDKIHCEFPLPHLRADTMGAVGPWQWNIYNLFAPTIRIAADKK